MGTLKPRRHYLPKSMAGQMIGILALSLILLLAVLTVLEVQSHGTTLGWAGKDLTFARIKRLKPVLERMDPVQIESFLEITSLCHQGYTVTAQPFPIQQTSRGTRQLRKRIANSLNLQMDQVAVGRAWLSKNDFSYHKCSPAEIDLPLEAIVISVALTSGSWLNAEIHPHEWHVASIIGWLLRSSGAFLFIGGFAIFFMYRLGKPLERLTQATRRFASGLEPVEVKETGPPDLRRAIASFNAMQQEVSEQVDKRMHTLAAISHDLRTPLTALRLKAELIDDGETQQDVIASIEKMEKMTASALAYLKGESRAEPMRLIDIHALVESECAEFSELGRPVQFLDSARVQAECRPDALARAVRNLIDNAVKYGAGAEVSLQLHQSGFRVVVSDSGPGIPPHLITSAMEPFSRLSSARESHQGGFGLGFAVVQAIAKGHGGQLLLEANQPKGLLASLVIPFQEQPIAELS